MMEMCCQGQRVVLTLNSHVCACIRFLSVSVCLCAYGLSAVYVSACMGRTLWLGTFMNLQLCTAGRSIETATVSQAARWNTGGGGLCVKGLGFKGQGLKIRYRQIDGSTQWWCRKSFNFKQWILTNDWSRWESHYSIRNTCSTLKPISQACPILKLLDPWPCLSLQIDHYWLIVV